MGTVLRRLRLPLQWTTKTKDGDPLSSTSSLNVPAEHRLGGRGPDASSRPPRSQRVRRVKNR